MPILWGLADPKLGEREVLAAMLEVDADLVADRPGLLLITDKGFAGKEFEQSLRSGTRHHSAPPVPQNRDPAGR
ncbi:hypothetical protein GCM10023195_01730 [Actinoallomurus liliacearum]|uniref:Transposase IS4-like domain-containing protein n=1 Tax=Actinoallomurus liliacearum TaxID=1080073 RepID=A0ABP8TB53_9ACTN